jgi:hypothetical protein
MGEMIHPIFMDSIARDQLGVDRLYPVKIRKYFWWELLKTLNRFGRVSLIGLSVILGLMGEILTRTTILTAKTGTTIATAVTTSPTTYLELLGARDCS